jgi:hypothetical protein
MSKIKTILSMNILAGMISFQLSANEKKPIYTVTGSRLNAESVPNLNHVTIITRKHIDLSGMKTVSDIYDRIPFMTYCIYIQALKIQLAGLSSRFYKITDQKSHFKDIAL